MQNFHKVKSLCHVFRSDQINAVPDEGDSSDDDNFPIQSFDSYEEFEIISIKAKKKHQWASSNSMSKEKW